MDKKESKPAKNRFSTVKGDEKRVQGKECKKSGGRIKTASPKPQKGTKGGK